MRSNASMADASRDAIKRRYSFGLSDKDKSVLADYVDRDPVNDAIGVAGQDDFSRSLTGQGPFRDTGRYSSGPGEAVDALAGAPARAGLDALATAPPPRDAFDYAPDLWRAAKAVAGQFGKDPKTAPVGYDVANHLGIENPYLGTAVAKAVDFAQLPLPGAGIAGEIEEVEPEVAAILDRIKTPELAVALKGAEREQYLKALDAVYGDRAKRASDMGFGDKTYYHGSNQDIQAFDKTKASENGTIGKGFYFAEDPDLPGLYGKDGSVYPVKLRANSTLERTKKLTSEDVKKLKNAISPDQFKWLKNDERLRVGQESVFSPYRGITLNEGGEAFQDALKKTGYDSVSNLDREISVLDPNQIRSVNAAFDPRFKDSSLLLAGRAGLPAGADLDKLALIQALRSRQKGDE
jgi:hypothetical protein